MLTEQFQIKEVSGIPLEVYRRAGRGVGGKYDQLRAAMRVWITSLTTAQRKDWKQCALRIRCANRLARGRMQSIVKNTKLMTGNNPVRPPKGYEFFTRSTPIEEGNKDGAYYLYIGVRPISK